MFPEDCTNPERPCSLHDERNEWIIEFAGTTIHSGWFIAVAVLAIALSTAWWFNI